MSAIKWERSKQFGTYGKVGGIRMFRINYTDRSRTTYQVTTELPGKVSAEVLALEVFDTEELARAKAEEFLKGWLDHVTSAINKAVAL